MARLRIQSPFCLIVASFALAACGVDINSDGEFDGEGSSAEGELESVSAEEFESVDLGEARQSLMNCSNPDGANSVMAALGVATAQELGRWEPVTDFVIDNTYSLALSATGKSRCADKVCKGVQALLDMQKSASNGKVKLSGGVVVNSDALRTRLFAKFGEQKDCQARGSVCSAPSHKFTFVSSASGACDTIFTFRAQTPTGGTLTNTAALKNRLVWLDVVNPYIQFTSSGDKVSIDPTYGLNEVAASAAGSCAAACTKISASNIAGQCCSCSGATKKYARSAWNASTYLCQ